MCLSMDLVWLLTPPLCTMLCTCPPYTNHIQHQYKYINIKILHIFGWQKQNTTCFTTVKRFDLLSRSYMWRVSVLWSSSTGGHTVVTIASINPSIYNYSSRSLSRAQFCETNSTHNPPHLHPGFLLTKTSFLCVEMCLCVCKCVCVLAWVCEMDGDRGNIKNMDQI